MAYRGTEVEDAVLAGASVEDAAAHAVGDRWVADDVHADREYRAAMAVELTRRALEKAFARAG
jgi:CO/xanthine dehydrogenase FAD-binding subunit